MAGTIHYKTLWLTLGWLYVITIIYGSLSRVPDIDMPFSHTDKLVHFLMYFILTGWFGQIYKTISQHLFILIAAILLGITIEFLQGMTSYRSFDYLDALANSIGALTAYLLLKISVAGNILKQMDQQIHHWLS